jgi:hypothetical protein
MLTIVDLHQEEELSSSSMGKVGGGMSCETASTFVDTYIAIGDCWMALGSPASASDCYGLAEGIAKACA